MNLRPHLPPHLLLRRPRSRRRCSLHSPQALRPVCPAGLQGWECSHACQLAQGWVAGRYQERQTMTQACGQN